MEKKLSAIAFAILFMLHSQQAFAQSSCGLVTFAEDSFTLDSDKTKAINFTVKNFDDNTFTIDELAIENNPFFSSGKTSAKIFEGKTSLIPITVTASNIQETQFVLANVSIIGHFEDGTRCFLEKEFYFQINPTQEVSIEPLNVELSVWSEVDFTGSGFVFIETRNDSRNPVEIVIESRGARFGLDNVWIEAFSLKRQTITINEADDNELIFFKVYSGTELLFEKFTQIKYPAKDQKNGGITFEDEDTGAPVFISSYSQKVEFVGGKAEAWVLVENKSSNPIEVFVELKNLPQGINSTPISAVILPSEKKQFNIGIAGNISEEFFTSIISVNGDGFSLNRLVLFEQQNEVPGVVGPTQPGENFGAAAFLFLSQNALGLVVLLAVLVLLVLAISTKRKESLQAWVARQ